MPVVGLNFKIQSRMPVGLPAVMGGRRMDWNYSEIISPAKWVGNLDAQASLKSSVLSNWSSRADEAGYRSQGGKPTETITPLWRDPTGSWTEVAGAGQPEAYRFSITGTVVPK